MKNLWALTFLLSIHLIPNAVHAESGCDSCVKINEIILRNDLNGAVQFMNQFQFSKDPTQAQSEAYDISRMAAKFIPASEDGFIDEFYYSIYQKNPKAMKLAHDRVTTEEKQILDRSYKQTQKVRKNGNGQNDQKKDDQVAKSCPEDQKNPAPPPAHKSGIDVPILSSIARALSAIPSAAARGLSPTDGQSQNVSQQPAVSKPAVQKNMRGPASVEYYPTYEDTSSTASE